MESPFVSSEVEIDAGASFDFAQDDRTIRVGTLAGIARHDRPRGAMETVERVAVTQATGIQGDFRGAVRPGKVPRRQITLFEGEGWDAAMTELGRAGETLIPWWQRRVNLCLREIRLPRCSGYIVAVGASVRILVTGECDPCSRMEEIAPGLKAVLMPDWRGGFTGRVLSDGEIAVGDTIRIEQ